MSRDTRHQLLVWSDATIRLLMRRTLSARLPLYLVPEFPKSGGSWFGQMLAAYLNVPFPRNQLPPLRRCVLHGHYLYRPEFENVFCVVRDGRDIMVSFYYHCLFHHDRNPPVSVEWHRGRVPFDDYENISKNLPAFIEYVSRGRWARFKKFGWAEFIQSYWGQGVAIVKYEDLLRDAAGTVGAALEDVLGHTPDMQRLTEIERQFSFESQAGRKRGTQNNGSFLRKGIAGDWKNHFTKAACETFDQFGGDCLIKLGYEQDRSWICN